MAPSVEKRFRALFSPTPRELGLLIPAVVSTALLFVGSLLGGIIFGRRVPRSIHHIVLSISLLGIGIIGFFIPHQAKSDLFTVDSAFSGLLRGLAYSATNILLLRVFKPNFKYSAAWINFAYLGHSFGARISCWIANALHLKMTGDGGWTCLSPLFSCLVLIGGLSLAPIESPSYLPFRDTSKSKIQVLRERLRYSNDYDTDTELDRFKDYQPLSATGRFRGFTLLFLSYFTVVGIEQVMFFWADPFIETETSLYSTSMPTMTPTMVPPTYRVESDLRRLEGSWKSGSMVTGSAFHTGEITSRILAIPIAMLASGTIFERVVFGNIFLAIVGSGLFRHFYEDNSYAGFVISQFLVGFGVGPVRASLLWIASRRIRLTAFWIPVFLAGTQLAMFLFSPATDALVLERNLSVLPYLVLGLSISLTLCFGAFLLVLKPGPWTDEGKLSSKGGALFEGLLEKSDDAAYRPPILTTDVIDNTMDLSIVTDGPLQDFRPSAAVPEMKPRTTQEVPVPSILKGPHTLDPRVTTEPRFMAEDPRAQPSLAEAPSVLAEVPRVMAEPRVLAEAPRVMAAAPRVMAEAPRVMAAAPKFVADAPKFRAEPTISEALATPHILEPTISEALDTPSRFVNPNRVAQPVASPPKVPSPEPVVSRAVPGLVMRSPPDLVMSFQAPVSVETKPESRKADPRGQEKRSKQRGSRPRSRPPFPKEPRQGQVEKRGKRKRPRLPPPFPKQAGRTQPMTRRRDSHERVSDSHDLNESETRNMNSRRGSRPPPKRKVKRQSTPFTAEKYDDEQFEISLPSDKQSGPGFGTLDEQSGFLDQRQISEQFNFKPTHGAPPTHVAPPRASHRGNSRRSKRKPKNDPPFPLPPSFSPEPRLSSKRAKLSRPKRPPPPSPRSSRSRPSKRPPLPAAATNTPMGPPPSGTPIGPPSPVPKSRAPMGLPPPTPGGEPVDAGIALPATGFATRRRASPPSVEGMSRIPPQKRAPRPVFSPPPPRPGFSPPPRPKIRLVSSLRKPGSRRSLARGRNRLRVRFGASSVVSYTPPSSEEGAPQYPDYSEREEGQTMDSSTEEEPQPEANHQTPGRPLFPEDFKALMYATPPSPTISRGIMLADSQFETPK